jgi:hypothetical protein
MVIPAFECLRRANIRINVIKYAYNTEVVFFVDIFSRHSFKNFKKISGDAYIIKSLKDFRRKIEEYVYELQKY